jgi:hypothetical protein
MKKRAVLISVLLGVAGLAGAAVLNEWNFYSDPAGRTLSQTVNSKSAAVFSAGGTGFLETDGRGALVGTYEDVGSSGMWTNGAILNAALGSAVSDEVRYLRFDFSYDLSSTNNNSGTVLGFAFRDSTGAQMAGVGVQYDTGSGATPAYTTTEMTALTNTAGTVAVIARIDLMSQTLDVWYNLIGNVSGFSEGSPHYSTAVTLDTFDSLRFHATGDMRPAGSADQVAANLLRTADSWVDILSAEPQVPADKYRNEWTFERDIPGLALSDAINSGTNSPLARFAAGSGSAVFTTNRALLCIGEDVGTGGVWTNGALLDAALPSSTSGVHYLRYDVAYSLTNSANNSGTVLGVYFSGDSGTKVAGLILGYDKGTLESAKPSGRTLTIVPGAEDLAKSGTLCAVAEVNLDSDTVNIWYDLSGSNTFVQGSPVFTTNITLAAIDNLRFHATGDFRPAGATDYAAVDNIRHSASWAEVTEPPANLTAPPALAVHISDSLGGTMDIGQTNLVTVVISNSGGAATHVTSMLTHDGAGSAFTVISNNAAGSLDGGGATLTNTYEVIALQQGSYVFTATGISDQTNSAPAQLSLAAGANLSFLAPVITEVSGGVKPGYYEPGETLNITIATTNDGARSVSNIVNTLSAGSSGFTVTPASASYVALVPGARTSTVYQVLISPAVTAGSYTFFVTNRSGSLSWTDSFSLNVFKQSLPSVSPTSIAMSVLTGAAVTNTQVTVTNAGNVAFTFNITDDAVWGSSYVATIGGLGKTAFATYNNVIVLKDPDTTNPYNSSTNDGVSAAIGLGFGFPFYGATYSNFYITADGYIGLSNTTNVPAQSTDGSKRLPATNVAAQIVAPFWGTLSSPAGSVRYAKDSKFLAISFSGVAKESGGTNLQFQVALFTNGCVEFRYKTIAGVTDSYGQTNVTIGIQGSASSYTNLSLVPVNGTSVLLTPQPDQWVRYTPTQGTVAPQSSQVITFIADASRKTSVTSTTFKAQFNWSTGGSNVVTVTANVIAPVPVYSAVSSISFTGTAGQVTNALFVITNAGTAPLTFTISNSASASAGYITTNPPPYGWIDISTTGTVVPLSDPDPSPYITAADEGSSSMIPLSFVFPFYGSSYTQLSVSVNGALRLDTTNRVLTLVNLASTSRAMPAQMIAPYWGDLVLDENSTLKYKSTADRFVVTWENVRQYGSGGGSNLTFQTVLTPDGGITFQYKKLEGQYWENTTIGLRDTSSRTVRADIRQPGDWSILTNLYGEAYTQYVGAVSNRIVQFQFAEIQTIRYTPPGGSIPAGSNAVVTIIGDASNQSAGTNSIVTSATLTIAHNASTNRATLAVTFKATNSQEAVFVRAAASVLADGSIDSDGDGVSDDQERIAGTDPQNADSVFTPTISRNSSGVYLSWPAPLDGLQRNCTIYFTTNLMSLWEYLYTVTNGVTYLDTMHSNVPVIYYKITVPIQ